MSSFSKPHYPFSCQRLFIVSLLFISLCTILLVMCFKPKTLLNATNVNLSHNNKWFDLIASQNDWKKPIKIGFVNVDGETKHAYVKHMHGIGKSVSIDVKPLAKNLTWNEFFPEWIDEEGKWIRAKCPEMPMPERMEEYGDLDVIVAKVPCEGENKKGIRDLLRLQVNLVVANLAVVNGKRFDRTVYVVFIGWCGPMVELFCCDEMLTRVGEYWVYRPEIRRLMEKVSMPVGSCQIAAPVYTESGGKEVWRFQASQQLKGFKDSIQINEKVAYVTVLHSSEAYVCGAIALAQSIKQTRSNKPLILLHDSSISDKALRGLEAAGWETRRVSRIRGPFAIKGSYNEYNYSKLRIWQLIDFDKVIFVDSDMLILQNIDWLFNYPQLSASSNDKYMFNSGIMVVEPSNCMFEYLVSKSFELASYNGGDQGFLNEVFTWWHRLPSKVNFLKIFGKTGNNVHNTPDGIYGIHLLGWKPWMCYRDYDCNWDSMDRHIFASDSAHKKWWKVYDSMPKKLQGHCAMTKKVDAITKTWRGRAVNASFDDGHWKIKIEDPRQHQIVE